MRPGRSEAAPAATFAKTRTTRFPLRASCDLREDRSVEGGRHFGAYRLHCCQHGHFRQVDAHGPRETDRVLANVPLLAGIGCDVERDVAEDEAAPVGWHRHHRQWLISRPACSFASFCMTACNSTSVCRLPFISAATSPLPAAIAAFERIPGPVGRHDPILRDVQAGMVGGLPDRGFGAVKNGQDQPGLGGLYGAGQGIGAARMHDAGQHRLERSAALDQPFEPMSAILRCCRVVGARTSSIAVATI